MATKLGAKAIVLQENWVRKLVFESETLLSLETNKMAGTEIDMVSVQTCFRWRRLGSRVAKATQM